MDTPEPFSLYMVFIREHFPDSVKSWFEYKIHLVVDSKYELPIAYEVTTASEAKGDRGYDAIKPITKLWDNFEIKPIIYIRNMWKDGETTKLVKGSENVAYNFKGEVFSY